MRVACATPALGLSSTVVGPIAVAPGTNVPKQVLNVFNAGDGVLSLTVTIDPSVTWVSASLTPTGNIQFSFQTASLARGLYTAQVTVADPNALNSPQSVTVTVQIGTWPASVDQWLAPGTTKDFTLEFAGQSNSATTPPSSWLLVAIYNVGTLKLYRFYAIHLAPPADMTPGTYSGTVTTNAGEDIPVTMRLTTQPIGVASVDQLTIRLPQGGPPLTDPFLPAFTLTNSGRGTLVANGASANVPGVTAAVNGNRVVVTADPGSLVPGKYSGQVTIQCNGANCPLQVPVTMTIAPQTAPLAYVGGVVDNSSFLSGIAVSPGDVVIVRGEQLSLQPPTFATGTPLPTILGGASVLVNGVAAPLFYTSVGQIAFLMPSGTATGTAFVQVVRDTLPGNQVPVSITPFAPRLMIVTDTAYNPVNASHPAKAGDILIIWAIGMGPTNPIVPDGVGAPSNPPALLANAVRVTSFRASTPYLPILYAGLSPGSVGLYQIVVQLPADEPSGMREFMLQYSTLNPTVTSNAVPVVVQ
jgi:uncharacterized protein (TIGR03437 family)